MTAPAATEPAPQKLEPRHVVVSAEGVKKIYKQGDVETVRKVDDAIEGMVKNLDGSFPDLMQVVEQHEAADRQADEQKGMSRDKRTDGMNRRIGDAKPTSDDMRKRMADKSREKIERRTSDSSTTSSGRSDGSDN